MRTWLALTTGAMVLTAGCGAMPEAAVAEVAEDEDERLMGDEAGPGDFNWLMYVANYDVSEIKLAHLAEARSGMAIVQEFGTVKAKRHQQSFDAAVALAAQGNTVLPAGVTIIGEQHFRRLNHIGAALFDREFLALQVQLHKEAARAAAAAAAKAPAGEVREWAARAWDRWHRDEVWAGRLYQQVLTGHGQSMTGHGAHGGHGIHTAPTAAP